MVAALSHPNILAIHDFGAEGGTHYAVMELLVGETLRSRMLRSPLTPQETITVGLAIAARFFRIPAAGFPPPCSSDALCHP